MKLDEQRRAIAEAIGWRIVEKPVPNKNVCPFELIRPDGTRAGYTFHPEILWSRHAPDFPSDLNAAIQLCDKLAEEGWSCELSQGTAKGWECTFCNLAKALGVSLTVVCDIRDGKRWTHLQ